MREVRQAVLAEVDKVPGADVIFEKKTRRGHFKATISYRGRTRFVIIASTASDHRATKNLTCDVRKQLRELGALQ